MGMLGFSVGEIVLVQAAWMQIDGIFNLIFLLLILLFFLKERYGKYPLTLLLIIWLISQFRFHWFYTIFGASAERIANYYDWYSNTFFVISSETRIIPDLWHMVLHILVLCALISMIRYCIKGK